MGSHNLFVLGRGGVNITVAPTHLQEDELLAGQNVEISTDSGDGGLDQRVGMSRINATPLNSGASVLMAHDMMMPLLSDYTPTLYAPFVTAGTFKWRKSTDGAAWSSVNLPNTYIHNPPSTVAPGYFKACPKVVTVGRYMYFAGAVTNYGVDPIPIWQFDGTNAQIIAYIPPAVFGTVLSTPGIPIIGYNGSLGTSTWKYKVVAKAGSAHSAASAEINSDTALGGASAPNSLTGAGLNNIVLNYTSGSPVAGATSYDVYRTGVGSGTPNTTGLIGNIAIVNGAFTTGNGSAGAAGNTFMDAGLSGDGTTPPASATGSTVNNALVVLDIITDGTNLYIAVLDIASTSGRLLSLNPTSGAWSQIGAAFPTSDGNGTAGTLVFHDGSLNFGTYFGTASGNAVYAKSTGTPLTFGGISAVHSYGTSVTPTATVVFNGALYTAFAWLGAAGTAAVINQRTALDTWTSVRTGPGTAVGNAYTTLGVFNGRIFAGWTSGDGSSAARIESSPDGVTWVNEISLDVAEVPAQMVVFNNALYVALGKTTASYNTKSRIIKRDASGTWTTADDPADDYAGAIGVVYA